MAVDAGDWCYHWPRCATFDDCQAVQVSEEGWTVVDQVHRIVGGED
jgi:hypothetical protein